MDPELLQNTQRAEAIFASEVVADEARAAGQGGEHGRAV
jgi:hypothetical protein